MHRAPTIQIKTIIQNSKFLFIQYFNKVINLHTKSNRGKYRKYDNKFKSKECNNFFSNIYTTSKVKPGKPK
ncbi:unnamed protein product [marine sediment metagenome]|uniref:Uncharacterized protein n=1 Tax=marine sediment metagenome TaxID=412755 RepID=X1KXB3_9ZZZZ